MATVPHQIVRVGPWGEVGPCGEGRSGAWDDVVDDGVVYSGIRRIRVSYDGVGIRSIYIEYDSNGSTVSREHGGSTGNKIRKIQLDYPKEILTSISGFYDTCITSLTFERNWNSNNTGTLGSGHEGTAEFSSPKGDVKIVGFHGRSDEYLRSIGVYYLSNLHAAVPPQSFKTIVFGQLEGEAGYNWDDDRVYSGIRQIIVIYGNHAIDSINIEYDNNGSPFWLELGVSAGNNPIRSEPGVRAGNKIGKIRLHYPHEILTSISGHYDTYLRSLTFESNLGKIYGPYGPQRGTPFESPRGDWKIVGFHGRSAPYLDFQDRSGSHFYCIGVSLSFSPKSLNPISVGPWGGEDGDIWDDGVYSGIHQIIVVYDKKESAIASIDIQYDNNGSRFWLEHGGSTGNKIEKIQLDYPNESLSSISGSYDDTSGIIRRLTFESNLGKKYGPYGSQRGTPFESPRGDWEIVGFHGRSDEYLRSIGVYYLSNLHTQVSPKEYPGEGEPEGSRAQEENTRAFDLKYPREGEPALMVGESIYARASQATREGKKEEGSRAREEEDTRGFDLEYPPEGEHASIVGEISFNPRAGRKYRGQDEGEDALIKEQSLYPSAKKAQEAERKKKGGGGSRAREEEGGGGSRACEEEEGKEEKEAEGSARYLSSLHI